MDIVSELRHVCLGGQSLPRMSKKLDSYIMALEQRLRALESQSPADNVTDGSGDGIHIWTGPDYGKFISVSNSKVRVNKGDLRLEISVSSSNIWAHRGGVLIRSTGLVNDTMSIHPVSGNVIEITP